MIYFDLDYLCARAGIHVYSYADGMQVIKGFHLEHVAEQEPAFSCYYQETPVIFFDSARPAWKTCFSVAKCIGFFTLGYLGKEFTGRLTMLEGFKADLFALKLLFFIARVNPHFPADIIQAELARLKAIHKQKVCQTARPFF